MKKYVYPVDLNTINRRKFDVIIVGEGLAGLYASLNISKNLKIALLSKSTNETSSYLSQGGVAAVINSDDNYENHIKDTLIAGAGLCDESAVKLLVEQGPQEIKQLLELNVPFDKNSNGKLQTTLEGGHSMRRILHCGGDKTGQEIVEHLMNLVQQTSNIEEINNSHLIDIISKDNQTTGVLVYYNNEFLYLNAPFVILCTGGIGALYPHSTNPSIITGDGIAAAYRAGCVLKNMEFVQFHPTSFYDVNNTDKCFLISEAVRGEGGVLRNQKGEAFMKERHLLKDLAPRDIVAREITKEINNSDLPFVYLDITHKSKEFLQNRFPTIYNYCLNKGVDISKDWIKVRPVQHYFMGGIETDLNAKTNIKGLYACGETAYTGVHGANRLASNSLLECLVFSKRATIDINNNFDSVKLIDTNFKLDAKEIRTTNFDFSQTIKEIQSIMHKSAGIVRNHNLIIEGINDMKNILSELSSFSVLSKEYLQALNMATVGLEILNSALARKENIGAHFRDDV